MRLLPALIAATAITISAPAIAAQAIGKTAQDFKLTSAAKDVVQLTQFRGRPVVLEWHNPGCPFVQKHYRSDNMQATQEAAKKLGAVWLTINSGASGKQGHLNGAQAATLMRKQGSKADHYLLDRKGVVGKAYAAKTTPHMYVIDAAGKLVYQGAIDDKPTANPADIDGARNHVLAALIEMKKGQPVSVSESRPYGCSVKYAN